MKKELLIQLIELAIESKASSVDSHEKHNIGRYVIVRCRDAGVHAGVLVDYYDRTAVIENSRRLWRWWSASENTLSGVARCGIKSSKSNIAGEVSGKLILPEFCEIIPCTDIAEKSIAEQEVYNEQ